VVAGIVPAVRSRRDRDRWRRKMLQQAKSFRLLTRVPSDGERGPIAAVFIFAGAPVFGCVKVRSVILEEIPVSFGRSCATSGCATLQRFAISRSLQCAHSASCTSLSTARRLSSLVRGTPCAALAPHENSTASCKPRRLIVDSRLQRPGARESLLIDRRHHLRACLCTVWGCLRNDLPATTFLAAA
jgi:hypothetical protein